MKHNRVILTIFTSLAFSGVAVLPQIIQPTIVEAATTGKLMNIETKYSLENGNVQVSGWHIDSPRTYKYEYIILMNRLTNLEISRQKVNLTARPDVKNVYPSYANASQSGFNIQIANPAKTQNTYIIARKTNDITGNGAGGYSDTVSNQQTAPRFVSPQNNKPNFPDPTAITVGTTHYAYATSTAGKNIPVATYDLNGNYGIIKDAMPNLPNWAKPGIWAPHITKIKNTYYLYFSAEDKITGKRSIGVATANSPTGVFIPRNYKLASDDAKGGLIDPSIYMSNSTPFLLYKNDGNAINQESAIWIRELRPDGLGAAQPPLKILANTDVRNPTEPYHSYGYPAYTIEAPYLTRAPDGKFVLFFSGNGYGNADYFTGYAISNNLLNRYTYQSPLYTTSSTGNRIIGPGGGEITRHTNSGALEFVLHGWVNFNKPSTKKRQMYVTPIAWNNGHVPSFTK